MTPAEEDKQKKKINSLNKAIVWEKQIDVDECRIDQGISTVFFAIRSGILPLMKLLRKYGANFNMECMSESK
jgi:hypothetical protein